MSLQAIYPTADGWVPPSWPTNEELLKAEEDKKGVVRKNLVKRQIILTEKQYEKLSDGDFMKKHKYSLQVYPLREDTLYSGPGEERGYITWIYYEPRDEQNVTKIWDREGAMLKESERMVVDPDTTIDYEKSFMYSKTQILNFNVYEWEVVKDGEEQLDRPDGIYWP